MEHDKVNELQKDIEELNQILAQATRENVITKIKDVIKSMNFEMERLKNGTGENSIIVENANISSEDKSVTYSSVQSHAWNQEGNKINIFLTIDKINEVKEENIVSEFDERSIEVKIHNVDKKNYRFCIKKLFDKIKVDKCSVKVKKSVVQITLVKQDMKNWSSLHFKDTGLGKFKPSANNGNVESTTMLMDMMKHLYQEGDSEFKRTMAKAWYEAQEKKSEFSVPNF